MDAILFSIKAHELELTTRSQAFTRKCACIDYFPFICSVPWLFVCSEFFHLIWGVRYSFHLQCAVDFFIQWCWFNFTHSVFDLVCSGIFL